MLTQQLPKALQSLAKYLDRLTARADLDDLRAAMIKQDITLKDLAPFVRFSDDRYQRNLICHGDHYHMLCLCWKSGQRSPIHNHAGSVCGLKVLTGTATETVFEQTSAGYIKPTTSHDLHANQTIVSHDRDIHQISNLQDTRTDLVTLHIYSPPLLQMDTYSLTDNHVGQFRPMVVTCTDGDGI